MLHIQHTYISRGSGGINFNCSGVNPADFLKHFLHKCSIMGEGRKFKLGGGRGGRGGIPVFPLCIKHQCIYV